MSFVFRLLSLFILAFSIDRFLFLGNRMNMRFHRVFTVGHLGASATGSIAHSNQSN